MAGAPDTDDSFVDEGLVRVWLGAAAGVEPAHAWEAVGGVRGEAHFGSSVACGDLDGDGFADLIVGASGYQSHLGDLDEGRVSVFLGAAGGPGAAAAITVESDHDSAGFGHVVASAGDTNGDGRDDTLIAAGGWDDPLVNAGAIFLYLGR